MNRVYATRVSYVFVKHNFVTALDPATVNMSKNELQKFAISLLVGFFQSLHSLSMLYELMELKSKHGPSAAWQPKVNDDDEAFNDLAEMPLIL